MRPFNPARVTAKRYYHTGTNSFDNPEVKGFYQGPDENERSGDFNFGPFSTFRAAKKDLVEMIRGDIGNLRYCLTNVLQIKAK